jgi:hypothetical protein
MGEILKLKTFEEGHTVWGNGMDRLNEMFGDIKLDIAAWQLAVGSNSYWSPADIVIHVDAVHHCQTDHHGF